MIPEELAETGVATRHSRTNRIVSTLAHMLRAILRIPRWKKKRKKMGKCRIVSFAALRRISFDRSPPPRFFFGESISEGISRERKYPSVSCLRLHSASLSARIKSASVGPRAFSGIPSWSAHSFHARSSFCLLSRYFFKSFFSLSFFKRRRFRWQVERRWQVRRDAGTFV